MYIMNPKQREMPLIYRLIMKNLEIKLSYLTLVMRIPIWYTTEVLSKMARHAMAFLILEEEWF